jgi:hypothetical protein
VVISLVAPQMLNTPQMPDNLVSGPNSKLRMRADLYGSTGGHAPKWKWTVTYFGQSVDMIVPTVISDPTEARFSTIEFPVANKGQYKVSVDVDTGLRCLADTVVTVNAPGPASYLFRVTPPNSLGLGIPVQETRVTLDPGNPVVPDINLLRGTKFSVAPQDTNQHFISAYVRVSLLSSGVTVDGYTANGPVDAYLLSPGAYDVLIVPDGDLAPVVFTASAVQVPTLSVDPGTYVDGTILDGDGAPVAGARVVLRAGMRPSTVGISDGNGRFSVRTRPGIQSAVIVPPVAAGLPEARVSIDSGMAIDASTTLKVVWRAVKRGPFSLVVLTNSGSGPVAGSRVRVESEVELDAVGTVSVSGTIPATIAATGSVRVDALSDDTGLANFSELPVGAYKVTVVPPASMPGAALTIAHVDNLTEAGYAGTIPLARHVMLNGILLPEGATTGVRVLARDRSTGIVAPLGSAIVGDRGAYSMAVDPGRTYQLIAEPPPGSKLVRTVLGDKDAPGQDTTAGTYTVPAAVLFDGRVTSGLRTIGDAVVQVFCSGPAAACRDPSFPIAEVVTGEDGSYTVALPAPTVPAN